MPVNPGSIINLDDPEDYRIIRDIRGNFPQMPGESTIDFARRASQTIPKGWWIQVDVMFLRRRYAD